MALPVAAQPASDLLQSAIFAQETAGDLDGAIRIYRQILSSSPDLRLYAAQAQFRLDPPVRHTPKMIDAGITAANDTGVITSMQLFVLHITGM